MYRVGLLCVLMVGSWQTARAEGQAIAGKAGFLGLGVEYTYALNDRVAVRGGINGAQFGFDGVESDIAYDFELIWDSISLSVDLHPLKSPFRLTAGLLLNDNGLRAESRPVSNIEIGGTTYTPSEVGTLSANIGFDHTSPFIGLGWDWSRKSRRFGVSFDLGVLKQGSPRLTLVADGSLVSDPRFQQSLATETAELEDDLSGLDLFPFATLGFVVKF